MPNATERLKTSVWKHPECYGGFSPDGDYLVMSRNRDSSLVERVNWDVAVESLKAEAMDHGSYNNVPSDRPAAYHWRAGHAACGWVEYLMVRADAPDAIKTAAGEIMCSLSDYLILDEHRYGAAECEAVDEYWASCSVSERMDYLRDAGLSIFAARRDYLPSDDNGALFQTLREGL